MISLESDEDVQEVERLKILTRNKLSIRLPVSLAEIKVGNNSYKLKKIGQILFLLYWHNKITKKLCNNLIKP